MNADTLAAREVRRIAYLIDDAIDEAMGVERRGSDPSDLAQRYAARIAALAERDETLENDVTSVRECLYRIRQIAEEQGQNSDVWWTTVDCHATVALEDFEHALAALRTSEPAERERETLIEEEYARTGKMSPMQAASFGITVPGEHPRAAEIMEELRQLQAEAQALGPQKPIDKNAVMEELRGLGRLAATPQPSAPSAERERIGVPHKCPRCNASGWLLSTPAATSAATPVRVPCPPCGGSGILWSSDRILAERGA